MDSSGAIATVSGLKLICLSKLVNFKLLSFSLFEGHNPQSLVTPGGFIEIMKLIIESISSDVPSA